MFLFKVKKKRIYKKGVLVIGEIQHGEVFYDEDVIVRVELEHFEAHVDAINSNYPHGETVYACSKGTNVGLFLSNVDYHKIVLGKTIIEGEPYIEEEPVITHKSKKKENKMKVKNIIGKIFSPSSDSEEFDDLDYQFSNKEKTRPSSEIKSIHRISEPNTQPIPQLNFKVVGHDNQLQVQKTDTTTPVRTSTHQQAQTQKEAANNHRTPKQKSSIPNTSTSNNPANLKSGNVVVNKSQQNQAQISLGLSSEEKEFIFDIKHCLKDQGKISPTEFFILDKIRASLSIKKSRAKELISLTVKDYSLKQNEIEYRDAVSICLMDSNFISSTERFLLERLRMSLNIDQSKAYDIERNCQWVLEVEKGKK